MQITTYKADHKTAKQLRAVGTRLTDAGIGYTVEYYGFPKELIRVSCYTYNAQKILDIITNVKPT